MALDPTAIRATAKAAVRAAMTYPDNPTTAQLYDAIADSVAAVVPAIVEAIVANAVVTVSVTGVQAGSDHVSATGTIA